MMAENKSSLAPLIHYIHDPVGNISNLNDINNSVLSYAYDATGRLVSAVDSATNGFGSLAWTYDLNGNRQSETRNAGTMPYVYSPPNWLYQKGAETRPRTANGNTQSTSSASFTYDGYNRLISSQTAAETTTYSYNALGQRIKKINQNGLATSFHYGPDGELLYEQDQAGNTKAYVWLNGRPLARIDNNAQIYYYHVDHLGTPQAMSDSTGSLVWKAAYEPFGRATVSPASTVENNLRLPGQYYDRETGLHYNYFRDYDPSTGRYVEADPIGLVGGMNIYAYGAENPLLQTDPLGLANGPAIGWMRPRAQIGAPRPIGNMSFGAGGAGTLGPMFGSADSGLAVDTKGNICFYSSVCTGGGANHPLNGTLGLVGSVGTGELCSGQQKTRGAYWYGGKGIGGEGTVQANSDGLSYSRGVVGPTFSPDGGRGGAGYAQCTTTLMCF